MELGPFFWFGGPPGQPLPDIAGFKVGKHTKGTFRWKRMKWREQDHAQGLASLPKRYSNRHLVPGGRSVIWRVGPPCRLSPDPRENEVTAAPTYLPVPVTGLDVPREVRAAGGQLLKQVNKLDLPGQRWHLAQRSRESGVGSDQAGVESNGQGDVERIVYGLSDCVRQGMRILGQRPARH